MGGRPWQRLPSPCSPSSRGCAKQAFASPHHNPDPAVLAATICSARANSKTPRMAIPAPGCLGNQVHARLARRPTASPYANNHRLSHDGAVSNRHERPPMFARQPHHRNKYQQPSTSSPRAKAPAFKRSPIHAQIVAHSHSSRGFFAPLKHSLGDYAAGEAPPLSPLLEEQINNVSILTSSTDPARI
ncbi:hypothetical protein V8C44DRAFT_278318 [Trichoderma aethiopicum]